MKNFKKLFIGLFFCASLVGLSGCAKKTDFTVGVVQLVQHEALDKATEGFVDELKARVESAGKTITIDVQIAAGDSINCTTIANKFVASKYDLIMANATPALQAAAAKTNIIPILGTSITEFGVALGINNFSGVTGTNVSGTSDLADLSKQADLFEELLPGANKIGILYCSSEANSVYQANEVKRFLEAKGKTVVVSTFTDSNDMRAVVSDLCSKVEAMYIPTDNVCADNADAIYQITKANNVPVIAGEESLCKKVGIATFSISYYSLGKVTGQMAAEILLEGSKVGEMAIRYDTAPVKKYNSKICNEMGISVPSGFSPIEG